MNSSKTKISESIVTDAVKPDKLAYIYNTPVFTKKSADFDSFEKYLLYILMFARKYPDSGSIKTMLSDVDKRVESFLKKVKETESKEWEEVDLGLEDENKENETENIFSKLPVCQQNKELPGGSVRAMTAICVQIALENAGCCHYALRVMSRMVDSLKDEKEKWDIFNLVYSRLRNRPNSDYNQLWLQNITYQKDNMTGMSPYKMRLCRVVAGDKNVKLWNNEWLKPEFTSGMDISSIIDKETLKKVTPVITFRETRNYNN